MLAKDSLKSKLFSGSRSPLADTLIKHLDLRNVERVISGKPNTLIMVTKDKVVKMPLDKPSEIRCRVNKTMLKKLRTTNIANLTPHFFEEGRFEGRPYYCEERMPGTAIDLPLSRMDEMIVKAADFITKLHQETACDIVINEANFKRLFGRDFARLMPYVNDEYRTKLTSIEKSLKKQLMGKPFKTVWFHGDFKVENVLFDTSAWQIKGIIDWDLSRQEGLPLLDILYLLMYKDGLIAGKSVTDVFQDRFLSSGLLFPEKEITGKYMRSIKIPEEFLYPLLVMFWVNHIVVRYRQQLARPSIATCEWFAKNVCDVIDVVLNGRL